MKFKIILLVLLVVFFMGLCGYAYYVNYQYEKVIGSYMENAKDMNTPLRMIEQLELAKQGMRNEGLKETDYGALIFKKPDNSMKFQYQHIDSIIDRAKAVESWYNEVYEKAGQAEILGDVYEQKMDNLREFIMEETRSDWIAKNCWYIKNHIVMYFGTLIGLTTFLIIGGFIIWIVFRYINPKEKAQEEGTSYY